MDTPDISMLRTLPARYRVRNDGEPVEMEFAFYRTAKVNHSLPLYTRVDDKTKLITLEENTEGERIVISAIKDWSADDEDCTLPRDWVCEFEMTDKEMAIKTVYLQERNMSVSNNDSAEVLPIDSHQGKAKGAAKAKKIASKQANAKVQGQETAVGEKMAITKPKNGKKKTASTKALEEDAAMAEAEDTNPKTTKTIKPTDGKSGASLSIMEAASQLALAENMKKTKTKKHDEENTNKMVTDSRSKNAPKNGKTPAKQTGTGKDDATKDLAKDLNDENAEEVTTQQRRQRTRSMSIGDSQERLTVLERAKALAESKPTDVHTGTMAKIIADREKKEHAKAVQSSTKNSSTAKKSRDTSGNNAPGEKDGSSPKKQSIDADTVEKTSKKRSAEKGNKPKKNEKESKSSQKEKKSNDIQEKSAAKESSKSPSKGASSPAKLVSQSAKKKQLNEDEVKSQPAEDIGKGWISKKIPRHNGKGSDTYFYTPNDRIKVRSRVEALKLIAKLKETNGDEQKAWKLVKKEGKAETPDKGKKRKAEGDAHTAEESKKKKKKSKRNKKEEEKLAEEKDAESVISQDY